MAIQFRLKNQCFSTGYVIQNIETIAVNEKKIIPMICTCRNSYPPDWLLKLYHPSWVICDLILPCYKCNPSHYRFILEETGQWGLHPDRSATVLYVFPLVFWFWTLQDFVITTFRFFLTTVIQVTQSLCIHPVSDIYNHFTIVLWKKDLIFNFYFCFYLPPIF